MLSRSLFCLQSNITRLASAGRCYLWTFTRRDAEDYIKTRGAWNKLLTYLRRRLPEWSGVRVYEVHPGKWGEFSHGLHVHVVCNKFFCVDEVRAATKSAGWGRVHVARVRKGSEHYVTKYLRKKRPAALKSWRLSAVFGMPDRTRLADCFCDSLRARLMRVVHRWHKRLTWGGKLETVNRWMHRFVRNEFSAGLWVATQGQYRDWGKGKWSGWVPAMFSPLPCSVQTTAVPARRRVPKTFHPLESLGSVWGLDFRKNDLVANERAAKARLFASTLAALGTIGRQAT
jgi:hypothetical protein